MHHSFTFFVVFVSTLQVDDVKKLCKACGVDPCGSKTDLILRLHNEIRSRSTYDKIFEKIWGASGKEPYSDYGFVFKLNLKN